MSARIISFGHEDFTRAAQIVVVGRGRVNEGLRGSDAVLLQHHHEHVGIHERAGVK